MDERVDLFYEQTGLLDGHEIVERPQWNTLASADAIRHFRNQDDVIVATANGKVNYDALPVPEATSKPGAADTGLSPQEAVVAAIWGEVLGVAVTSKGDDFFALGGHSLAVLRVLARLRDKTDVELAARQFFDAPTVGAVAAAIESAASALSFALPGESLRRLEAAPQGAPSCSFPEAGAKTTRFWCSSPSCDAWRHDGRATPCAPVCSTRALRRPATSRSKPIASSQPSAPRVFPFLRRSLGNAPPAPSLWRWRRSSKPSASPRSR